MIPHQNPCIAFLEVSTSQHTSYHKISFIAIDIKEVKEIRTKRGDNPGQRMAFVTGADKTGLLDSIVIFPDKYLEYKRLLVENNTVIISGERGKDNSFIISKVYQV